MDESTDIGPLAQADILASLTEQLRDAREKGAEVIQTENSFSQGLFLYCPAPYIIQRRR